jgi:dTDP-4-amino-4,6-dideoxygalactose transaminase
MHTDRPIYATQPEPPPLDAPVPNLEPIRKRRRTTDRGTLHERLEARWCEYLEVQHLSLVSNGTIALVTALQALRVTGEAITTPYSFVATSYSLLWNGIRPVFVDFDPVCLSIDPSRIEEVSYAAAHAFEVRCDCGSLLNHGDPSVPSLHATQVFNTLEGGAKAIRLPIDPRLRHAEVDRIASIIAAAR